MKKVLAAASSQGLTAETLPLAIGHLLELNNYAVRYSVSIHGAEVDIVATPKSDPFLAEIYIEATVQYVDNVKYGKDLTKFHLIKEMDPGSVCICVSSNGFTKDVRERAEKSRILTETYDDLFRRFERFSDYINVVEENIESASLANTYEFPRLNDAVGNHDAVSWFNDWRHEGRKSSWVVLLGEYGTGKTALTVYLQRKWLLEYKRNPTNRIPIRIELRSFIRQFDANSLLHHFLDSNALSHIPLEYLRAIMHLS